MSKPAGFLGAVSLVIILPSLGALVGLAYTWYDFEFDPQAVGFLTIFYYLIQVIWLVLCAVPNAILGAIGGLTLAALFSIITYFVKQVQEKKALKDQRFDEE